MNRQPYRNGGSLLHPAFQGNGAVVILDYPGGHGQTQTCAILLGGEIGFENLFHELRRYTAATVADVDNDFLFAAAAGDYQPAPLLHCLDAV